MSRLVLAGCIAGAGLGCGNSTPTAAPTTADSAVMAAGTAILEVEMIGFRSDKGSALVGLYVSKDGFPDDGTKARERIEVEITNGQAAATFTDVPATQIAISVLHDEDGDKRMKTGLFGRPKEGYGVTRDAKARFGPPSFADAAIAVSDGQRITTRIKLRY